MQATEFGARLALLLRLGEQGKKRQDGRSLGGSLT